ncbi:MAG: hypothetical protein AAFV53_00905 [Myxococcota bacterium]
MSRNLLLAALLTTTTACGPEVATPDGVWNVTVTGDFDDRNDEVDECAGTDPTTYSESFGYQLFFNGTNVDIRINDEDFAAGARTGCTIEYQSAAYLEEDANGSFQWEITGEATYQAAAGACLDGEDDWVGEETIEVIFSDNEAIPVGCEYRLQVTGTYQGG